MKARASGALLSTERAIAIENVRRMTRSHAPIDVRRIGADCREFRDSRMIGSEVTNRVSCGGVSGKGEGLAAATAEIEVATRTTRARLLHPCGTAESIEGRRIRPDIGERAVTHVPEFKAGDRLSRGAGQHLPRRRHVERAAAPATDARLWIAGVVVGHDRIDDDAAVGTRAEIV